MAFMGCHTHSLMICAIGCGETSRDGGFGVFVHGDEVLLVFGLWFSQRFFVRFARFGPPSVHLTRIFISTTRCSRPKCVSLESTLFQNFDALQPIDVATWARTVIIPRVFERKRPTTSDHASTMILSMLWVSLGHVANVSFACKAQGSLSTTSHIEFLLRSSGKP